MYFVLIVDMNFPFTTYYWYELPPFYSEDRSLCAGK